MLLGLSYLALFVDKQNPGRPGIHSVTVLTELTLASAQRQQLPPVRLNHRSMPRTALRPHPVSGREQHGITGSPRCTFRSSQCFCCAAHRAQVNDEMWIMQFQNTILFCHIAIFLEFGVVHYAARQIQRQRAKHKDADVLMPPQSYHLGSDYYRSTGAGSIRPFASEYGSEDTAQGRSALRAGHSGENSGAAEQQHTRSNDSGAERRSSRTVLAGSGINTGGSDAHGFSIQEDAVIGMPSVVNMLTETLNRADDPSTCFDRFLRCRRTTIDEHEEFAEVFGSSLAAQGALRARTWHRCGRCCCACCLTRADLIDYVWRRWSGLIDWLARFTFPPAFGCYYIFKMASVDALCVLRTAFPTLAKARTLGGSRKPI